VTALLVEVCAFGAMYFHTISPDPKVVSKQCSACAAVRYELAIVYDVAETVVV
jgi:hypothetical protein